MGGQYCVDDTNSVRPVPSSVLSPLSNEEKGKKYYIDPRSLFQHFTSQHRVISAVIDGTVKKKPYWLNNFTHRFSTEKFSASNGIKGVFHVSTVSVDFVYKSHQSLRARIPSISNNFHFAVLDKGASLLWLSTRFPYDSDFWIAFLSLHTMDENPCLTEGKAL